MANKIREKIGSKLGSIEKRIEKTFEKTLEKTLQTAMNSPLTAKAANAAEAVQARVDKARTTAKDARNMAQATAKQSLDQVLLGLEHKLENNGVDVKQKKDLIYAVGKKVLERAEVIRGQVAANPMAPTWIKGMNLNDLMPKAAATTETAEATEFGADYASASEGETQAAAPKQAKVKVGATEGDSALAEAAAHGDGEAEEALEDSAEEKSAGFVAEGAKVTPSASAGASGKASKASKASGRDSGKSPIEEAVANTQAGVKQAEAKAKSKKKTSSTETTH
ncbi:MAG: DUF3235 domain-containing protein [Proteobacteria bacterium]|nr:MAG: DUF3235 domain-containing protein [Pseudomonadota bacterium]